MASADTFKPQSLMNPKHLDSVMASSYAPRSSSGAFHGHIRDSANAALTPFSIEDLDILDGPDALHFFEQEALLVDTCHTQFPSDGQEMSPELSPTWSLNELYSQEDELEHASTPAITTSSAQHVPSTSHMECDTPQQKRNWQSSKLSAVPIAPDRLTKMHPFSRLKFVKNASKHADCYAADGNKDGKAAHTGKASTSKNIISERKRRRKLNERLYSLRALVPKISKMDKASIVNDAIDYVQNLQKLVKDMEDEVQTLQTRASGDIEEPFQCANGGRVSATSIIREMDYKILKVDVATMEETTYHLRILCIRGHGVFVKLAKAMEALQFEIVSANLTSIKDRVLNTIFMKAKDGRTMEPRELREMILEVVPRFGLGLAQEG